MFTRKVIMKSFKSYVKNRDLNEMAEMALPAVYDVEATKKEENYRLISFGIGKLDEICVILDKFFDPRLNPAAKSIPDNIRELSVFSDNLKHLKSILEMNAKNPQGLSVEIVKQIIAIKQFLKNEETTFNERHKEDFFRSPMDSSNQEVMNNLFLIPAHFITNKSKELYKEAMKDTNIASYLNEQDIKILDK